MLFRLFFMVSLLTVTLLALPVLVEAMPGANAKETVDVFVRLDADGSGEVSKAEFMKAMPDMREEAFNVIDKDKNGSMIRAEWEAFFATHNQGGMSAPQSGMGTKKPAQNDSLLIRPPKADKAQ